jgi:hypothetical protein
MRVFRLPIVVFRGLLLALLVLTTRDDPPDFCPPPREYLRVRLEVAICLDTSSSNVSTVLYASGSLWWYAEASNPELRSMIGLEKTLGLTLIVGGTGKEWHRPSRPPTHEMIKGN